MPESGREAAEIKFTIDEIQINQGLATWFEGNREHFTVESSNHYSYKNKT